MKAGFGVRIIDGQEEFVARAAARTGFQRSDARDGWLTRKRLDAHGNDETIYLAPLDRAVASGLALADELLEKWQGEWDGSFAPLCSDYAY